MCKEEIRYAAFVEEEIDRLNEKICKLKETVLNGDASSLELILHHKMNK